MRSLHIDKGNGLCEKYLKELEGINKGPKVFWIYHRVDGMHFTLVTTSKDVHLDMAQQSEPALSLLCQILDGQFGFNTLDPVSVTVSKPGEDPNSDLPRVGVFVTLAESSSNKRVFHLSKA